MQEYVVFRCGNKVADLQKILSEYLFQFLWKDTYVSVNTDIDLINLTICKWENDKFVADEWLSFEGVVKFIEQNELHDIYVQFFSQSLSVLPPSAQGFIMEKSFLVLLHLLKGQSLLLLVPEGLRFKLSKKARNWVNQAQIVSYPIRFLSTTDEETNIETLERELSAQNKHTFEFSNVSAPEILFSGPLFDNAQYWFALGMKYSSGIISNEAKLKNERVVQLENLFYSLKEEKKFPSIPLAHEPFYLRKISSIKNRIAMCKEELRTAVEKKTRINLASKLKRLETTYTQLEIIDKFLCKNPHQFRLRIEIDQENAPSEVVTSPDDKIVDVRMGMQDYLDLWKAFPAASKKLEEYLKQCYM